QPELPPAGPRVVREPRIAAAEPPRRDGRGDAEGAPLRAGERPRRGRDPGAGAPAGSRPRRVEEVPLRARIGVLGRPAPGRVPILRGAYGPMGRARRPAPQPPPRATRLRG